MTFNPSLLVIVSGLCAGLGLVIGVWTLIAESRAQKELRRRLTDMVKNAGQPNQARFINSSKITTSMSA